MQLWNWRRLASDEGRFDFRPKMDQEQKFGKSAEQNQRGSLVCKCWGGAQLLLTYWACSESMRTSEIVIV